MSEIIKDGYNDKKCEGNSSKCRIGGKCIEINCNNPAGTAWSPYWCVDCNIKRMDKITKQLDDIVNKTNKG